MKNLIYIYSTLLLVSCSSFKEEKSDVNFETKTVKEISVNIDLITTDMAALDSRIRAKLIRSEKIKDLSIVNNHFYLARIDKYSDPSEREYVDYIKSESTEFVIKGKGLNFAICTRNLKLRFVLCDRADTSIVDDISEDISVDLSLKVDQLLSK